MSLLQRMPHLPTLVRPVDKTDRYGNTVKDYGPDATRTVIRGWLQNRASQDIAEVARNGQLSQWVLYTLVPVERFDRIEWGGHTFSVDGIANPASSPRGVSHYEVRLRLVEG